MTKSSLFKVFVTVSALACMAATHAPKRLPRLQADAASVSVSGLSSGAFMAVQYDVAYSASTIGVGVVAGGPYNCAYVNAGGIATCMQGSPVGALSYDAALGFAGLGQIDSPDNLKRGKVYLFSGTNDTVVNPTVMNAVRDFYRAAAVPVANILYVNDLPAGHAFISADFGKPCATNADPYVNQCTVGGKLYDQAGAILQQIYGPLQPKSKTLSAQPTAFDQTAFGSDPAGMAKTGYVYIPKACRTSSGKGCRLHVVFHGCKQGAGAVHDDVYGKAGYNEWADANRIVVLYPQVDPSAVPVNPDGCWDWWGYTGLSFQTQWGPQLAAVKAMVDRLTGK